MSGIAGMNVATGVPVDGLAHLRQSVRNILQTPRGSRVMRRDYGSDLYKLVDQNLTGVTLARIYAATVLALRQWEPRLKVLRVTTEDLASTAPEARIVLTIEAEYLPDGRVLTLDGVQV
jgi:hypothetical protein